MRAVEPLQHRYAYIGTDLQDLYGVRPGSITGVTALQDAYFQGGTARSLMDRLAAAPDSILVSAETVQDYQLVPGDTVNLRLPDRATGRPTTVPFRYAGVVTEFPTAPRDSFFVANADYVAARTGSDAVGTFLVDTGGRDTTRVATDLRALLGTSATVTDVADTRSRVGSSLTSVDLAALTRVELGFALVLAAAAGGLVSFLGLTERRRSFAIIGLLGATSRQSRALVRAEVSGARGRRPAHGRPGRAGAHAGPGRGADGRVRPSAGRGHGAVDLSRRHRGHLRRRARRRRGGGRAPAARKGGGAAAGGVSSQCARPARRRRSRTTSSTSGISETTTIRAITGSR